MVCYHLLIFPYEHCHNLGAHLPHCRPVDGAGNGCGAAQQPDTRGFIEVVEANCWDVHVVNPRTYLFLWPELRQHTPKSYNIVANALFWGEGLTQ